jgi:hypothetical integral membrane protein (TIGR02206 family)
VRQFSPAHLAALAVTVATVSVSVWAARRHPGPWQRPAARALAIVILAGWAGEYVADAVLGIWAVRYDLPLQLTDVISITAAAALWNRQWRLVELTYFWALSASLQALLTPDLAYNFPSVFYFTYFIYHVGAVVAACWLVFGLGLYPTPGAVRRVYLATLAWTAVAALGDIATGGNYMYLRDKPVHNTLLSVLGPWPWYIVASAGIAFVMLLALSAIARGTRRLDPRARECT